jgi:hypothetical protein
MKLPSPPGSTFVHAFAASFGILGVLCAAHAHDFCVATAAGLQSALTDASDGGIYANESSTINIRTGTYVTGAATGNGPFHYSNTSATSGLYITGGNNAGCAGQTHSPATTILDGQHATAVMQLRSSQGNIIVTSLTLQNGESPDPGSGIQINYTLSPSTLVYVENSIIRNNHSDGLAGGVYIFAGDVALSVDQITGNSADQFGAGFVVAYGSFNEHTHVTVAKNTASTATSPVGGLYCGGSAACSIGESIFWNNTTYGLYLGAGNAQLYYNDYGARGGNNPLQETFAISANPNFVNEAGGNFHLSGTSPALGFGGVNFLGVYDLDDHPLAASGKVDLGAYEETVFVDNFDDD